MSLNYGDQCVLACFTVPASTADATVMWRIPCSAETLVTTITVCVMVACPAATAIVLATEAGVELGRVTHSNAAAATRHRTAIDEDLRYVAAGTTLKLTNVTATTTGVYVVQVIGSYNWN